MLQKKDNLSLFKGVVKAASFAPGSRNRLQTTHTGSQCYGHFVSSVNHENRVVSPIVSCRLWVRRHKFRLEKPFSIGVFYSN